MITFDGTTLKCGHHHSHLALMGGELQAKRTYFWGLKHASEIVSQPTFWKAHANVWITDATFTTRRSITDYLEELRLTIGDHGELIETLQDGKVSESWLEATFEGFEETVMPGHEVPGPIQDVAQTLQSGATTWFTQGILRWTLLSDIRGGTS